jgi:Nucleotidyl transferase AbiEii toxin, Type IV TA system
MPTHTAPLPDWELVLSSAARLQRIFPDAVLVGGTASAIHAKHRFSRDADHVLTDLRSRFDDVLAQLESVAGWKTARVQRPVQILGSLDGIETGIRQLIRDVPLETIQIDHLGERLTVPSEAEILRIKAVLILKRNATRDYLDFVALADHMGDASAAQALLSFDRLYEQTNGESPLQQLQVQLAKALPYDLDATELSEYKNLNARWHDWQVVAAACAHTAMVIFDRVCDASDSQQIDPPTATS